jgi:hypothetical protein
MHQAQHHHGQRQWRRPKPRRTAPVPSHSHCHQVRLGIQLTPGTFPETVILFPETIPEHVSDLLPTTASPPPFAMDSTPAFVALQKHFDTVGKSLSMRDLFAKEPDRFAKFR